MRLDEAKTAAKAINELAECQIDLYLALKGTAKQATATKKLWREGNKSRLMKLGIALIVFPDPSPTTEIIGACFVAAGAVQKGIQNRSLYVEDIPRTFRDAIREVQAARFNLQM
ncbi:MAG: hypothetical protein ACE14S_01550 [Candidatus Bathyarchaeia archaeon]